MPSLRHLRSLGWVLVSTLGSGLLALAVLGAWLWPPAGRIAPGVRIGLLPVGGYSPAEAVALLQHVVSRPIEVRYGSRTWTWQPAAPAGTGGAASRWQASVTAAVAQALAVGRQGGITQRLQALVVARLRGHHVPMPADGGTFDRLVAEVAAALERPARDARPVVREGRVVRVAREQVGLDVDEEELRRRLRAAWLDPIRREVPVPVRRLTPRLTAASVQAGGYSYLLGSFTTQFDPKQAGRVHNIRLAASALNGWVIQPGQEFSFNQVVGPRVPENGYQEAPVIIDGRFVPGIGGGVSQVATTLFNAALLAGLAIVERHEHALPVWYVALGRDATVWDGLLDLRLRNDTPGPVLVVTEVGEASLTVSLFGRARPPYQVEIETEVFVKEPVRTVYVPDPSLPPAVEVVEKPGRPTCAVNTWRVFRAEGQPVRREYVAYSLYQGEEQVIRAAPRPPGPDGLPPADSPPAAAAAEAAGGPGGCRG